MATDREIRMDFIFCRQKADRLESLGRQLRRLANSGYGTSLQTLANCWEGENADNYFRKSRKLKEKMLETADELIRAAGTARTIARNTYNAEMRAKSIVQNKGNSE